MIINNNINSNYGEDDDDDDDAVFVGPCHHGTARPQVVDGGTASDMEGSCE